MNTETIQETSGIVFYCDGSARPNNGPRGSGGHGYVWHYAKDDEKPTQTGIWTATNEGYVVQKDQDTSLPGRFIPVVVEKYLDFSMAFETHGTNNSAEIEAINVVFEKFQTHIQDVNSLLILTDSEYTQKEITKFLNSRVFDLDDVPESKPNAEALYRLFRHVAEYMQLHEFEVRWIKGHSGHLGNDRADWLATIGTNRSLNSRHEDGVFVDLWMQESPPKNYLKAEEDFHDFFCLKRIYYNSGSQYNEPGLYYMAGASSSEFIIGKRVPEAGFSVLRLERPDPVIEEIRNYQIRTHSDFNTIMYMKMDRLRSPDVHPYLREHGSDCLYKQSNSPNLIFMDKKPVSIECRPGELPQRAVEAFNFLESILDAHRSNSLLDDYQKHDITPHFYNLSEKKMGKEIILKKELHKELGVGVMNHNYNLCYPTGDSSTHIRIPLRFQDDLPDRNTMKRIEKFDPCVWLITWKTSPQTLGYAVIIQVTDAVGIWSNYFANRIFLP